MTLRYATSKVARSRRPLLVKPQSQGTTTVKSDVTQSDENASRSDIKINILGSVPQLDAGKDPIPKPRIQTRIHQHDANHARSSKQTELTSKRSANENPNEPRMPIRRAQMDLGSLAESANKRTSFGPRIHSRDLFALHVVDGVAS